MHLVSLGINQAKQVLLISDAAEWIWKHIPTLLKRLGSPTETYHLLDFITLPSIYMLLLRQPFLKLPNF
jgi:hypothetical protein